MSCTGPCNQGRKKCPTPNACELDDYQCSYTGMVVDVFLAAALTGCILIVGYLIYLML